MRSRIDQAISRRGTAPGNRAWPWLSLIPMGLGAWVPIWAGLRVSRWRWVAWGVLWTACTILGWVLAIVMNGNGGGGFIIAGWVGGAVTSFAIRGRYADAVGVSDPLDRAEQRAEQRLRERARGQQIARTQPELAQEMGIGRPDLDGSSDLGLVDVNNAPVSALGTLPGVDAALAARIDGARARVRGFDSLEDMGSLLDLDGALVDGLRSRVIFLPRPGSA